MNKKILLRGKPGIGKTTTIIKISSKFSNAIFQGFYTQEVRLNNVRVGFDVISFDGRKSILARKNIQTPHKVASYCVDIKSFEEIAIPALTPNNKSKLFIIDEIGKMECFSEKFINCVKCLFISKYPIIATLPIYSIPIINKILPNHNVEVIEINIQNREKICSYLINYIENILRQ